jgi:hypothetical protein
MVMFHKINVNASNNDIRRGGGGRYNCAAMGGKQIID